MNRYRPGPGWRNLGSAVWEHDSGIRIHSYGLCQLKNGQLVIGSAWPESRVVSRFVQINGGNRKRGVMAWSLAQSTVTPEPEEGD